MSTEQSSVDAATIEQTKQQIRSLVQEIAQLSKSDLEPEQYYAEVLQRVVTALAAVGGAVWTLTNDQRLRLDYQINLNPHLLDQQSEDSVRHLRLLQEVLSSGESKLVAPLSGSGDADAPGNPTNTLIVLAPMQSDDQVEGVLEIFQRPDAQPASQKGYLRFLVQMSQLVGDWLKSRKLRNFSDRQSLWTQVDHFAKTIHDSLVPRETAYTIANEGRRLIGCDRLSVAVRKGSKYKIEAVSGQDTMDSRSNVVQLLRHLATRVIAMGEPLWYSGTRDENLPPQVEEALDAYIDESHTKSLTVLPLRAPFVKKAHKDDDLGADEQLEENSDEAEIIGALILEQIETPQPRDAIEPRVDMVAQHSSRALTNSLAHENLFLMPLWRQLGNAAWLFRARTLPKTLLALVAIFTTLLVLCFWPKSFDLEAEGTLQPVVRRDVFTHVDGEVLDVHVKHEQSVKKGDLLVTLRSSDLEIQFEQVNGDLNTKRQELNNLRTQMTKSSGTMTQTERNQLFGKNGELEADLKALREKLAILTDKRAKREVVSPIDGIVVTWDPERRLRYRSVTKGQKLLEIADPRKEWQLEVYLPEKRMGHLNRALQDPALRPKLEVEYILQNAPSDSFQGDLSEHAAAAELHEEHGQTVLVRVDIDEADLVDPRKNMQVTADIRCGTRSLGYVWGHEIYETIQRFLF